MLIVVDLDVVRPAEANTVDAEGVITYLNPNLKLGQGAIASYVLFNVVFSFAYT